MADTSKETIYIDVDDEITSIVEKVRGADHKILALVLPKRTATLQSIVNMKLLKRTADEAGKKIVLITSEAGLLPLAGAVGLHVAKTLQSKPSVPPPPDVGQDKEIVTEDTGEDVDKNKSIGELAGMTAVAAAAGKGDVDEETIDVDSIDDEPAPKSKVKGKNKLKVPNFDKFRLRVFIAAGMAILLIVLLIVANKVLPKAKIVIKTNSVTINASIAFTANTAQKTLDIPNALVPAVQQTTQTTSSQTVPASGKKNVGAKATGSVTISVTTNCMTLVNSIPSGVTITNGIVSFTTGDAANFPGPPTPQPGPKCIWTSNAVSVTANDGGTKYNVTAGTQFTVNGYSATATNGAAMAGGTDKTVTVVSQADIDSAEQKASQDTDKAKSELADKFKELNLYALIPTLQPGKQTATPSTKVGDEASDVTVSVATTYTMLGVKQADLEALIDNYAKDQIDTKKQKISDYGLDKATITINSTKSPTNQTMSLQTEATAGASIDVVALKKTVAGKKSGDVKQLIGDMPSVQDVTVSYSPFWVTKAPGNVTKITIDVQKQQASGNDNTSQ